MVDPCYVISESTCCSSFLNTRIQVWLKSVIISPSLLGFLHSVETYSFEQIFFFFSLACKIRLTLIPQDQNLHALLIKSYGWQSVRLHHWLEEDGSLATGWPVPSHAYACFIRIMKHIKWCFCPSLSVSFSGYAVYAAPQTPTPPLCCVVYLCPLNPGWV